MNRKKNTFNQCLKNLRTARNLSQDDLAEKVGVLRSALSHWETGRREPNIDTIILLADYFNVSTDYLLGRTDNPKVNK